MSEPKPPTRAQIEALIWALELDMACLRAHVKYAKGIAILLARIDELRRMYGIERCEVRDERL